MSTVMTVKSPVLEPPRPPAQSWLSRFHTGWFAAVMGTVVIGVVANTNPGNQPALKDACEALAVAMVALARFLLVASYAAWGMGFFLFLLTAALLYARYVYNPLPKAPMAPAFGIGLGPIGVGGLTLLRMAQASGVVWHRANVTAVSQLSSLAATAFRGLRPLVAAHGTHAPGALPACRPPTVRRRLAGLRVPARRLHDVDARALTCLEPRCH